MSGSRCTASSGSGPDTLLEPGQHRTGAAGHRRSESDPTRTPPVGDERSGPSPDYGPAFTQTENLGEPVLDAPWLEPWIDEPEADPAESEPVVRVLERETLELAFVATLRHLPGTQRAVLILRETLGFSAAEVAEILGTTIPASVNSVMQRARHAVDQRVRDRSRQAELAQLGDDGLRTLVEDFMAAWEEADVPTLVSLLAKDAQFTMPPLPAWFDGRDSGARFVSERLFATPWRLMPLRVNAQPGSACYLRPPDSGGSSGERSTSSRPRGPDHANQQPRRPMFGTANVPLEWPEENLRRER